MNFLRELPAASCNLGLHQYLATRVNVDVEKALKQERDRCQLAQHISRKQVRPNHSRCAPNTLGTRQYLYHHLSVGSYV